MKVINVLVFAGDYLTFGIKQTNSTPIGTYVSTHVVISSDIDRTCKKLSNKVRLSRDENREERIVRKG